MKRVLIANRGAIARRLVRAMNELGVESLVIYSDADEGSAYIDEASSAVRMNGNRPDETYLNQAAILEIARKHGVDAIHPGYGFLSENASFARQVKNNGFLFIGPDPDLIEQMGEKVKGRETMARHGFPVFPGSETLGSREDLTELARKIGFPLVVKPSGGGGGIGMQVVGRAEDLAVAVSRASSIAEKAFSDPSLYLEKWINRPRHIEFQIIGDGKRGCVHAFDRECSVQRRHQKLFEEILKKTGQVNIMVRDVQGVDDNPFNFETVKKNILEALKDYQGRIKVTLVPNLTNICYGRGVGYKIEEIVLDEKTQQISATKIREQMRKDGKLK